MSHVMERVLSVLVKNADADDFVKARSAHAFVERDYFFWVARTIEEMDHDYMKQFQIAIYESFYDKTFFFDRTACRQHWVSLVGRDELDASKAVRIAAFRLSEADQLVAFEAGPKQMEQTIQAVLEGK